MTFTHTLLAAAAFCAAVSCATAATPPSVEAKGEDLEMTGASVSVNLGRGGSFSVVDSEGEVQASLPADLTARIPRLTRQTEGFFPRGANRECPTGIGPRARAHDHVVHTFAALEPAATAARCVVQRQRNAAPPARAHA